jgi:hypothetical protein
VARSGWIIGLIGLLTYPLQELLRMDVVEITLYGLTILIVVFSLWGTYWVYKNFDPAWLNIRRAVWGVLIGIIILVVIHTNQQYSMGYCFGINSLSSSLSCEIRNYLGVVGSTWVVITFILWAITYMSRQVKKYGGLSILWLVVLEPVWIMMFFNPTRILGVVLLNVIRSPEDLGFLNQLLTTNMRLLNILPIVAFFLLIPSGLFLLNSKEMQLRWTVLGSAVSLLIILGLLFFSLIISKSVFSYSIIDHLIFVLMAVQLWMPLLIGSHIVNDIHTA